MAVTVAEFEGLDSAGARSGGIADARERALDQTRPRHPVSTLGTVP